MRDQANRFRRIGAGGRTWAWKTIVWASMVYLALVDSSPARAQGPSPLPDFGGPSLLSRPGGVGGRIVEAPAVYRFYVSGFGHYSTELTAAATDPAGRLRQEDALGGTLAVGAYVFRRTDRSLLGLDYQGAYQAYSGATSFNGTDHMLTLNYSRRLTFRTAVDFQQGALTYGTAYRGYITPLVSDPFVETVDWSGEPLDARTYALVTSAGLSHWLSERWSTYLSGSGFVVRRHSRALVGAHGYTATGGVYRALTPHVSLGGIYRFVSYRYPSDIGQTDAHATGLGLNIVLSPIWSFSAAAGGYRAESERLVRVRLDPLIALLLGQLTALEVTHGVYWGTFVESTLAAQFERSSLSFFYARGLRPGTALFASSAVETVGFNYSYTATERLNTGIYGSYGRYRSLLQPGLHSHHYGAQWGVTYRLAGPVHLTAQLGARRYELEGRGFDRTRLYVGCGFTISPGERPLSLW